MANMPETVVFLQGIVNKASFDKPFKVTSFDCQLFYLVYVSSFPLSWLHGVQGQLCDDVRGLPSLSFSFSCCKNPLSASPPPVMVISLPCVFVTTAATLVYWPQSWDGVRAWAHIKHRTKIIPGSFLICFPHAFISNQEGGPHTSDKSAQSQPVIAIFQVILPNRI